VSESGIPEIHRQVRDGVPVFSTPSAPDFVGALMFRVGVSDETIATRGLTHLVEHLALFQLGRRDHPVNGFVDGLRTVFHATGTPDQVASFFRDLIAALADPPLSRIRNEARVLRTEAMRHGADPAQSLLWQRYGSRGHGLLVLAEWALDAPDSARVMDWIRDRFTADNAVAWVSGPVPESLSFAGLPRGRRCEPAPPEVLEDLRLPAWAVDRFDAVSMSFVAPRDQWIAVPLGMIADRLIDRLRFDDGLVYEVGLALHMVGARHMHGTVTVPCLPEHVARVQEGLFQVIEQFAADGPTADQLQRAGDAYAARFEQPGAVFGMLDHRTLNELVGYRAVTAAELIAEHRAFGSARCAHIISDALPSTMLLLPQRQSPRRDHYQKAPVFSRTRIEGRTFRSLSQRFPWSPRGPSLVVGDEGVSWIAPSGEARTVRFANCGARVDDGDVYLMGHDGFHIIVRASEWHHGHEACGLIITSLPAVSTVHAQSR